MRRPGLSILLAVLVASSVAACGSSGRDLRQPVDGAVSPTRPTSTTVAPAGSLLSLMKLTSTAFVDGGAIPAGNSCQGPSPALQWTGVAAGTKELVLGVYDLSDGFLHWLVTGISPTVGGVAEGAVPAGAVQRVNGSGGSGWFGPCPQDDLPHTYTFVLVALPQAGLYDVSTPASGAVAALSDLLKTAGASQAVLTGTFGGDSSITSPGSGVAPTLGTAPGTTRRR
jgi:phosphatidylethanolamine-binding protein (PEBP) family uncharacterized protein